MASENEPPEHQPGLGDFFWLGTACAISIVVAGGLGYLLDSWLGTLPWLTFAGLAFGILCAVLITVRAVRQSL
ncbi:MAG TPA: AtpZ/AtpI family protein [Acidimicrobiales bacterium]|nr:AtpZ/AtpI family protein [Acidimicrobiales bacterium]